MFSAYLSSLGFLLNEKIIHRECKRNPIHDNLELFHYVITTNRLFAVKIDIFEISNIQPFIVTDIDEIINKMLPEEEVRKVVIGTL